MRIVIIATVLGGLVAGTAAQSAAPTKINLQGVLRETPTGPLYLKFSSSGDLDGDGLADEGYLKLTCAGGQIRSVHYNVKSPRDSASGMASGKRTHHPVTFVKEWGPSTPQLRAITPTYDVKTAKGSGAKTMAEDSWTQISLSNADGLCAAAEDALGATPPPATVRTTERG